MTDTVTAHLHSLGVEHLHAWKVSSTYSTASAAQAQHSFLVGRASGTLGHTLKRDPSRATSETASASSGGAAGAAKGSRVAGSTATGAAPYAAAVTQHGAMQSSLVSIGSTPLPLRDMTLPDAKAELLVTRDMLARLQVRFREDRKRMAMMGSFFAAELERLVLLLAALQSPQMGAIASSSTDTTSPSYPAAPSQPPPSATSSTSAALSSISERERLLQAREQVILERERALAERERLANEREAHGAAVLSKEWHALAAAQGISTAELQRKLQEK